MSVAAFLAGRIRESAEAFDRAAILYVDSGQLLPAVSPRASRVHALVKLARPDDALADGDAAVDLARALRHPDSVCYGLLQRSLAVAALGRGLELADRVPYHWSHCANGLARLLIARGELDAAEPLLARSLAEGLPLTAYEARAAQVELLAARGQEAARPLAREAMALAEQGGYLVVMPRLQALTKVPPSP
jgi:hypothetical protein